MPPDSRKPPSAIVINRGASSAGSSACRMQLTKKQRLLAGPHVDTMLDELERSDTPAERVKVLVLEILQSQLAELIREEHGLPEGGAVIRPLPETRVCDVIDSRSAGHLKGWLFRHLSADVHTQDVRDSSLSELATIVITARDQPLGAVL
mmetsp:Transcript_33147/g.77793  ORF Transcript_33147/g.77793 Transcript_33147/m.77793 type:complete len:150 (-) Transcript_33147:364-813(-)